MISWLKKLFEKKKSIRSRKRLRKLEVKRIEDDIEAKYERDTIMKYYDISMHTYYVIKRGEHKYSKEKE